MEHLNEKQFNFNASTPHWDRHNYYSKEELHKMWTVIYNRTKEKYADEDLHQWSD